jgi:hypothetical protein
MAKTDQFDGLLGDEEDLDEMHDPRNAESGSIASVAKAADSGPKAKSRGPADKLGNGESSNLTPAKKPKTRTGVISDMYDMLKDMDTEELDEFYDILTGEAEYFSEGTVSTIAKAHGFTQAGKGFSKGSFIHPTSGESITPLGSGSEFGHSAKDGSTIASSKHKDTLGSHLKNRGYSSTNESHVDFTEDLNAIVDGEATLSEEFREKTAAIFEAAISSKLSVEVSRLEEAYADTLEEQLDAERTDLVEKVDAFLSFVVEEWMEENRLAVESGLRTEIAEGFMSNLKDLFEESYISVPESKVDLVDELSERVEELEDRLSESMDVAITSSSMLEQYQRAMIVLDEGYDLADTQVEKLKSLVEDVTFDDEDSFAEKVRNIKEAYFNKTAPNGDTLSEHYDDDDDDYSSLEVTDEMAGYVSLLQNQNKKQ